MQSNDDIDEKSGLENLVSPLFFRTFAGNLRHIENDEENDVFRRCSHGDGCMRWQQDSK